MSIWPQLARRLFARQIVEIVPHVAVNTLTNILNAVIRPEVDFPLIETPEDGFAPAS